MSELATLPSLATQTMSESGTIFALHSVFADTYMHAKPHTTQESIGCLGAWCLVLGAWCFTLDKSLGNALLNHHGAFEYRILYLVMS